MELGCYDGKLIESLPKKPLRYLGLDANWEGGLDIAKSKWSGDPTVEFRYCTRPEQMQLGEETFSCSFAMETLEHVPADMVDPYFEVQRQATRQYLFVTVPNEIGLVFLAKHFAKWLLGGDYHEHTAKELACALLGKTESVKRNQHKGFDYRSLRREVETYFEVIDMSGHPLKPAFPAINFGIGMICRPRE